MLSCTAYRQKLPDCPHPPHPTLLMMHSSPGVPTIGVVDRTFGVLLSRYCWNKKDHKLGMNLFVYFSVYFGFCVVFACLIRPIWFLSICLLSFFFPSFTSSCLVIAFVKDPYQKCAFPVAPTGRFSVRGGDLSAVDKENQLVISLCCSSVRHKIDGKTRTWF